MKNVSILGSTGSIGTQTLDVIRRNADINVVAEIIPIAIIVTTTTIIINL